MAYKIEKIEGIGPTYPEKLAAAGINTTNDLLKTCCEATAANKPLSNAVFQLLNF